MYYKIINKKNEVYKKLHAMRTEELAIEERNKKAIKEKIPYEYKGILGSYGQQNFNRVTRYSGFQFTEPEKIDLKTWTPDKNFPQCYKPNKRSKSGKQIFDFLENLEKSSFFDFCEILNMEDFVGEFSFPWMDIAGDIIILYLDNKFQPKDENIIEITKKEFEEHRILKS